MAPANVLRVIRLVRFGAAPATHDWSGADTTSASASVVVGLVVDEPVDLVAARALLR